MNKIILIGRLTADPEQKQTPSGVSVTTFTVAVNRPYSKERESQADFISVVAWRQSAEFVCRYFQKGKPILVEGRLQSRDYTTKDGEKRRVWEVQAENVSFVEGAARDDARGNNAPRQAEDIGFEDLPF
ncbi:MAG: single-stranded DNA-binding protein [Oscillospiraceae bacterium]|nr:single-stranded DNA-binding protein [Oscillospiraceae bacterium]